MSSEAYPKEFQAIAVVKDSPWTEPKKIKFAPKKFEARDIVLKIEACGVCGSDIHTASGNWGEPHHPCVVGHEIIGHVVAVGEKVTHHKIGDRLGIGAQAASCLECNRCKENNESYCVKGVFTYGSPYADGYISKGGYASHVIVHEHFAVPIPDNIPSHLAAPLLCGGLTAFSPLVRNNIGPGKRVGVVGIGGIGHMAILLAKALGAEVVAISRGSAKREDAMKLGADGFIATAEEPEYHKAHFDSLDFVLVTASSLSGIDFARIPKLLKIGGVITSISVPSYTEKINLNPLSLVGVTIGTSALGSMEEARQMLELVSKKNIKIWVETIPISEAGVAEVFKRMEEGDVKYRFTLVDYDREFKL